MNFRLKIAQEGVACAEKELEEWLKAMEKYPGLASFRPQNEQILRMNLEAAKEHAERLREAGLREAA